MLQSIDNMRTLAELCRAGEPLPGTLASWLASSLQSFLDQRSSSLNDAFGVRNTRGGIPWRMEASIRARDAALRSFSKAQFAKLTITAQAERIHQASIRYAASSWRFDREREEMPSTYRGTPQQFLWKAFKSGAAMPLCPRQLRTILVS